MFFILGVGGGYGYWDVGKRGVEIVECGKRLPTRVDNPSQLNLFFNYIQLVCKLTESSQLLKTSENKAIRDGKYLAPPHASVHPIKIQILIFFRDVISLLARVFIFLIDRPTQEVPMKNI